MGALLWAVCAGGGVAGFFWFPLLCGFAIVVSSLFVVAIVIGCTLTATREERISRQ
jgi:hypothetical protein